MINNNNKTTLSSTSKTYKVLTAFVALTLFSMAAAPGTTAFAHQQAVGCSNTSNITFSVFSDSLATTELNPSVAYQLDTVYFQGTIAPNVGDCAVEGGTIFISTPDGVVVDATPVLGVPCVGNPAPVGCGTAVDHIDSLIIAYQMDSVDDGTAFPGDDNVNGVLTARISYGCAAQLDPINCAAGKVHGDGLDTDEAAASNTKGVVLLDCGDGLVNGAELCDDGNDVDNDACSNLCVPAQCGDGIINGNPQDLCDDGNLVDDDACSNLCVPAQCGDGIINGNPQDLCDDGNLVDDDACSNLCVPAQCGDGIINGNPQEQCDDGNLVDDDACSNACEIPEVDFDGCTLGFWKANADNRNACQWSEPTDTLIGTVFGDCVSDDVSDDTLREALSYKGGNGLDGKERILLKQAVAAKLNIEHTELNYSISSVKGVGGLVEQVCEALDSNNEKTITDFAGVLDDFNNIVDSEGIHCGLSNSPKANDDKPAGECQVKN